MRRTKRPHHWLEEPRGWFDMFFAVGGWWVIFMAGVLAVMTAVSLYFSLRILPFERGGIEVNATVVETRPRLTKHQFGTELKMQFQTADGQEISGEMVVDFTDVVGVEAGSQIPIRYLASNPRRIEFPVGEISAMGAIWRKVALAAGLAALGLLWMRGMQVNRCVLARQYGQMQLANVEKLVRYKNKYGETGKGHMIWRVKSGETGRSFARPIQRLDAIGIGSDINVFVRGKTSVWEGDVGPRKTHRSDLPEVKR